MSLKKVEGNNNTYEWKLNMSENNANDLTADVTIDGYSGQVNVDYILYGSPTKHLCKFRLYIDCKTIIPVSYTFSILDHEGHAFVTTKGKVLGDVGENRLPMMFDVSYLRACNLIDEDILTVRFTFLTPRSQLYAEHRSHPTEGDFTNSLETLSKDFSTYYESKMKTDCVLNVFDGQFRVHRVILSARSSVFSAMFNQDTPESRSGEVHIPDVEATVLNSVLFYIYSGKVKGLTVDTATSMYTVADKYNLLELKTHCLEFLMLNLTLDNICKAALLADTHGEVALELSVVLFLEEKLWEVERTTAWQKLLEDRISFVCKLFRSIIIRTKRIRNTISK